MLIEWIINGKLLKTIENEPNKVNFSARVKLCENKQIKNYEKENLQLGPECRSKEFIVFLLKDLNKERRRRN